MASLDNQTIDLYQEIVAILTSIWKKDCKAELVVYEPIEGPMAYTYEAEGSFVKGLFEGNYNKRVLKNLFNLLQKDSDSSIQVNQKSLYSYKFFTVV